MHPSSLPLSLNGLAGLLVQCGPLSGLIPELTPVDLYAWRIEFVDRCLQHFRCFAGTLSNRTHAIGCARQSSDVEVCLVDVRT